MSRTSNANPRPFDFFLEQMWAACGGDPAWRDQVSVTGHEHMPSAFHATDLAAAAIGTAGLALAEWQAALTAEESASTSASSARSSQNLDRPAVSTSSLVAGASRVTVDRRLASLWFTVSVDPIGWELPPSWDSVAGDYRTADGWIRLHTNAPHHRAAALAVLDVTDTAAQPATRAAVAAGVAAWAADDLESAVVARGGCAATMRSVAQWDAHPQGSAVAREPLLHRQATGDLVANARPAAATASRPLAGIRVLDLTRVLAGPIATRFLAAYGAEVLRLDPPWWQEPTHEPDVTPGKRCARLDLSDPAGRARFEALLAQADVLVHGYRSDALAHLGLDAATRARICPGLVDVSLDAYGWTGDWKHRRGFDSLVQMSSGIAHAGMVAAQADMPVPLPMQALDHGTGYLMAAAVLRALTDRSKTGHGAEIHASLARTARLLVDGQMIAAGNDMVDDVIETGRGAGKSTHAETPDEARIAASNVQAPFAPRGSADLSAPVINTVWGPLRRLHAPVVVDGAAMAWDTAPVPLGSSEAAWRD